MVITALTLCIVIFPALSASEEEIPISEATQECLGCHESLHPGIVEGWRKSRHSQITPRKAMDVTGLGKKVSSEVVSQELQAVAVGCAECHTLRPKEHKDTFNHNEYQVHVVVSPGDCATCHAHEAEQYSKNIMAFARKNLVENAVYQDLQRHILGTPEKKEGKIEFKPFNEKTDAETCLYCHGTLLQVKGAQTRETMLGEMEFPIIEGWPNQGVGRVNLDGTQGACTACHSRHTFSMEMARKPHTCSECHIGPDVPVYKVYTSSKHGNIYSSLGKEWNFQVTPWTMGKDFTAPTCAVCHVSLLVNTDGEILATRTHQMSGRIPWRLFGLIYAHPHPKSPDTSIIRNKDGLPLPTDFSGGFAGDFLIGEKEQAERAETMKTLCKGCHSTSWVDSQWERFENTIKDTNEKTLAATRIMEEAWENGFAAGLKSNASPFDESVEKSWSDVWLFYANTVRFSSSMGCGGDYSVFADGRYQMTKGIVDLQEWLTMRHEIAKLKRKEQ
jgi:hypothetical protein